MAASMSLHELILPEPTYCKLKHKADSSFFAKLTVLQNNMPILVSIQKIQDKIMSEAKLLKIMIYKRNMQLRREKSLQLLKRVQACLKRASTFGRLFSLIDDIGKDVQSALIDMKKGGNVYLPAQQTWTYFLYLQLLYMELLEITASYCTTAFKHLSCQFATGMLIPQMIIFMGIVARIWLLTRSVQEKIQTSYSLIYSLRQYIERTNTDWKDPVLQAKLQLQNNEKVSGEIKKILNETSSVAESETVNVPSDEDDGIQRKHIRVIPSNKFFPVDQELEDIGEPVSIETTTDNNKQEAQVKNVKKLKHKHRIRNSGRQNNDPNIAVNTDFVQSSLTEEKRKKRKLEKLDSTKINIKQRKIQLEGTNASLEKKTKNIYINDSKMLAEDTADNKNVQYKKLKLKKKKKKLIPGLQLIKDISVTAGDVAMKTNYKVNIKTEEKKNVNKKHGHIVKVTEGAQKTKTKRNKAKLKKKKMCSIIDVTAPL